MNEQALRLWDLGYLWNIKKREDAGKLAATDLEFVSAVSQLQEFFREQYETVGQHHLGRAVHVDGVMGPVTQAIVDPANRVCGLPDIAPPDDIDLSQIEDPLRREALETMRGVAGGWRKDCYPQIKNGYVIKIHYNVASFKNAAWKNDWPQIKKEIQKAYAAYGALLHEVDNPNDANIRFYHRELRGGTIGLAQLPGNNASCSLRIWSTVDTDWGTDSIYKRYQVSLHEIGHSMDLQHTSGGVMNPSIIVPRSFNGFRNDPSERALKSYYGGVPIDLDDTDPDPKPDPEEKVLATLDVSKYDKIRIVTDTEGGGGWQI